MAQKRSAKLDPRLAATAALVRPDAIFADIGCDHGYLAIELMRRGAVRGYACDINPVLWPLPKKYRAGGIFRSDSNCFDRWPARTGTIPHHRCYHCWHWRRGNH